MEQKQLSELTDAELLQEARKLKTANIFNAVFIGFLFGIVFYSAMNNAFGLFMLLPLFFAYKLINNSKYKNKELEVILKERKLK